MKLMDLRALHCLLHLLHLSAPLLCSGTTPPELTGETHTQMEGPPKSIERHLMAYDVEPKSRVTQMDDIPTVPIINPSPTFTPIVNPNSAYPGLPPFTPIITAPPATTLTASSGQVWCVASQSASQTALQVALDYACGYGGADCSAIQSGGSCFNPDTLRDHASYAFNSYYQKSPVPTSCDFGGTAVITNTDPSTQNCQYPASSSTPSQQMPPTMGNPVTPTTPVIFGIPPPSFVDNSGNNFGLSGSPSISKHGRMHFVLLLVAAVANL